MGMFDKNRFASNNQNWETPDNLFNKIIMLRYYDFTGLNTVYIDLNNYILRKIDNTFGIYTAKHFFEEYAIVGTNEA